MARHTSPTKIDGVGWTDIALRFQHACALASDKSLWCWGWNFEGQLGQADKAPPMKNPPDDPALTQIAHPMQVVPGNAFRAVDTGDGHTCAIRTDGALFCWGRNNALELGLEEVSPPIQTRAPKQVGNATDWTQIQAGQDSTCGVRGGNAYCWGESDSVLGTGEGIPSVPPGMNSPMTKISGPSSVAKLSFHTFGGAAIDDKGTMWLWGSNESGQLGRGNNVSPAEIFKLEESGWTQVSVGHFTTCGVRGGQPMCTGDNDRGQLGSGDTVPANTFQPVTLGP